jgi:1,4-alpha-glucan branching enzyme
MKIQLHVFTQFARPGVHIWDEKDDHFALRYLHPSPEPDNGWWNFETDLPQNISIGFKLLEWNEGKNKPQSWESRDETFNRVILLNPGEPLPGHIWVVHGSNRVILENPLTQTVNHVRIHLITKKAYRQEKIFIWIPGKTAFTKESQGEDRHGPYFDLDLDPNCQNFFNFKFFEEQGDEPEYANRTWSSPDGMEIWTHSKGAAVLRTEPSTKRLTIHLKHEWGNVPVKMHLWQETSDFVEDMDGKPETNGWITFQTEKKLYTGLPYKFMFFKPNWELQEHENANRHCKLTNDAEYWTLEGSKVLFASQPERNKQISVEIVEKAPECSFSNPDALQVHVDKARADLPPLFEKKPDGTWLFWTYPEVVTSFHFSANQQPEPAEHQLIPTSDSFKTYIVLGRSPCLFTHPNQPLFADPTYTIKRPGVLEEDGYLRFALHTRWCSRVRLKGEWQHAGPVNLQSTTDGKYWWVQIPISEITQGLSANDYHRAWYQYILNDETGGQANTDLNGAKTVQDPAAGWVASTDPRDKSKLVNHGNYIWQTPAWQTANTDYLMVYELHPARLTKRNGLSKPFAEVAKEIESGYLKNLGFTGILLMPSNEFPGAGWGYNPSYYYAAKDSYGGPNELKKLIDVCHQHSIAVLLDVVFNHAGIGDNILWELDQNTYFDGDTAWGAMINFSAEICKEFFAQCLVYWNREYHMDGFRFDMTNPMVESHQWAPFIKQPNADNHGWHFLENLRNKLKSNDPKCLMMAEQLPNNWGLTNNGIMDTQWHDDYHDRLVAVCRGNFNQLSSFAEALKTSHTACREWYNVTPYLSSHDEVGNVNDRIANAPEYGRGLRINKVAATATMFSRGIPMIFMGEESGETGQFYQNSEEPLDLNHYEHDINKQRVRDWWKTLLNLRRGNPVIQGPSPLDVHYVDGSVIAFSRGDGKNYFVVLNFGDKEISQNLGVMNLPEGGYQELWNSTYPAFQVEWENEFRNWGTLHRDNSINIPDNGAVVLERVN